MGRKKEELILKAIEERKRYAGRHLLADTHEIATALVLYLGQHAPPGAAIEPVGSRR